MKRLLLVLLSLLLSHHLQAQESLTVGIVPQQSAAKLARLWSPLLLELEQRTGVKLLFRTAPDIPTFERRLAEGEYDLAYMNPYHYTVFSREPGYLAFAREQDKRIKGIIVVAKESPIQALEELQGAEMAFPAPAAFAASVLPRASLERMGINIAARYVGSHDSVYLAVARGLYPAGGGVVRTFNNIKAEVRDKLRILWNTPGYTPHAFAAHPRVAAATVERVRDGMIALAGDEVGRALLEALRFKQLGAAVDSDWDDVRELDIRLLDQLISE